MPLFDRGQMQLLIGLPVLGLLLLYSTSGGESFWSKTDLLIKKEMPPQHQEEPLEANSDGPKKNPNSTKWIVITTIQYPTEDIKRLAELEDWHVVVVGDTRTPKDWQQSGVHYLSLEKQAVLGFRSVRPLPYSSYTRKNAGYLYAISKGAQFIYDTDDDNAPFGKGLAQFDIDECTISGLRFTRYNNTNDTDIRSILFNPYRHFGLPSMWPRGFPLDSIKDHTHEEGAFRLCRWMRAPAVQQGIVTKDPDVDAIYRLLHADRETGLDESFNRFAPPVVLAPGTFAPWNSQNTLFSRNAMFGLFLPTSVSFRVTDIWRGYFTQALLHLAGESIGFYPPNAIQRRNPHNFLVDLEEETCMIELANMFYSWGFWRSFDASLVRLWVEDLTAIGYTFPPLRPSALSDYGLSDDADLTRNCRRAHFEGATGGGAETTALARAASTLEDFSKLKSWCLSGGYHPAEHWLFPSAPETVRMEEKNSQLTANYQSVAIITNNYEWNDMWKLAATLYKASFGLIFLCGTTPERMFDEAGTEATRLLASERISYIHLSRKEIVRGYWAYICLAKVAEMRLQNVRGYYMFSDDVLFNFWTATNTSIAHFFNTTGFPGIWFLWPEVGEPALNNTIELLQTTYKEDKGMREMMSEYAEALEYMNVTWKGKPIRDPLEHLGMVDETMQADFVYIPAENLTFVQRLAQVSYEGGIFHEIFFCKLSKLLPHQRHYANEFGGHIQLFGDDRVNWAEKYSDHLTMLHPLKPSYLVNSTEGFRSRYCGTYVESMYKNVIAPP